LVLTSAPLFVKQVLSNPAVVDPLMEMRRALWPVNGVEEGCGGLEGVEGEAPNVEAVVH